MPPAPGIAKFDEILLPTLDQSEPATGDTVVRTLLPFRHEGSQTAVESAFPDNQRASLIRATKMNTALNRLFVDFLFVDNSVQIEPMSGAKLKIDWRSSWPDLFRPSRSYGTAVPG
jgi:hypothetical protein